MISRIFLKVSILISFIFSSDPPIHTIVDKMANPDKCACQRCDMPIGHATDFYV
jgi:hypothetical protein